MIKAILTDIEGTTTSLSFVKDVLFPYARAHMPDFIRAQGRDPLVRQWIDEIRKLAGRELNEDEVIAQLIEWMDRDEKITPLKALQGMLWERGYRDGDFTGHVYRDAHRNLKRWQSLGIKLYVFSSGSVQAQKLLYSHSDYGDMTVLFSGFFDTTIGAKRDADAYRSIAAAIGLSPGFILFVSDVSAELDAARAAGMHTAWMVRDGQLTADAAHLEVKDFDALAAASFWELA